MLVVLSADMEGVSQLVDPREILACCPEYWETGKPGLEADVAAACQGLLAGGATEVVVLDNHASGNTFNIWPETLPAGARLEQWNVFDLAEHGVEAMFQVGYHARGGVEGFLSHTYVPGLRLRLGDELISESHGRAWAAGVPLLGVVGNDLHQRTLGSLAQSPFLVVQESRGRGSVRPVFAAEAGIDAIRAFAERCVLDAASVRVVEPPRGATFAASMPNGAETVEQMEAAGWSRAGKVEYAIVLDAWQSAREPLAAAMNAAIAPFMPYWLGDLATSDAAVAADREKANQLSQIIVAWANETRPEWFTEPTTALELHV
jgi:D-aminopeptidase